MKNPTSSLIIFFLIISSRSLSQKLTKADRVSAHNIQSHVDFLSGTALGGREAGSESERLADAYISGQFKKAGQRPLGNGGSWMQCFDIRCGKEVLPPSSLSVNGAGMILFSEFFPFAFSASKKTGSSVVMALSEDGVPWFADIKDLLDKIDGDAAKDTLALISGRAKMAASKGATALIVYNKSLAGDLAFDALDSTPVAAIPVLYVTRAGVQKYLLRETAALDLELNVRLKEKTVQGCNVVGFADNKADSTILVTAPVSNAQDLASMMELARLAKTRPYRFRNYLFVALSGWNGGSQGQDYLAAHPPVPDGNKLAYAVNFNTFTNKGLPALKQSIDAINALRKP